MTGSEFYQIRVKGHLDSRWSAWFDGLTIAQEESGETTLSGPIRDQAALHGVLAKVRDLGLPLLSVNRVRHDSAGDADARGLTRIT
jgi:hypothetical protein